MSRPARVLVLDVIDGKGFYEAVCDDLDDYYKHLKTDIFDIATRKIAGRTFDIFVDDVGLFVDNPIVSALDSNKKPALVGNLIFAHHNSAGETIGVADSDIRHLKEHVVLLSRGDKSWIAVYPVDYC